MIPVLSRAQSHVFDRTAIEGGHVPSIVLMENAGRGVVDALEREWKHIPLSGARAVVVAGSGNNGGDGFVIARHLRMRGAEVEVFCTRSLASVTDDARTMLDAMTGVGVVVREVEGAMFGLREALGGASFLVDAVFGTGLSRPVEGRDAAILEIMGHCRRPVVAVDVPSGLDSDTGVTLGKAVRADLTVTFAAHKLGLLTPRGAALAGKVVVADIGVPAPLGDVGVCAAHLLETSDVARLLSPRGVAAHKSSAGHVVILAGSAGHVGAAVMCAHGAFRAGAGLVTVATWPEVAAELDVRTVEVMTARLDRDDIEVSVDAATASASVVVVGPGFGKDDAARAAVLHLVSTREGTTVFDADAIAMFAGEAEVFAGSKGAPVLTPHPGELGVLLGSSAAEVEADRFAALASCVERARCVTVLKGAHTLIGAPDELPVVNGSGTSALATAGSGDVLGGTIGALACTLDPFEAAFAGVHLHGLGAEAWSRGRGDRGMLAHEIAEEYPAIVAGLLRGR
jgi:NAD(P)H-hydrate epimerase